MPDATVIWSDCESYINQVTAIVFADFTYTDGVHAWEIREKIDILTEPEIHPDVKMAAGLTIKKNAY